MAIWDWPAAAGFAPREVQVGVRTPKAGWQAAFSGDRTRLSHLGDRLRMTLRLPGCTPAEGAVREAFVTELVSAGHQVRLGRLDRPAPAGTLRGSPVVAVDAPAGARSVQVSGARAGSNLIARGGMEIDQDANDLADGWSYFGFGNFGTLGVATVAGNNSARGQTVFGSAVGPLTSDGVGLFQLGVPVQAGLPYTLAADTKDTVLTVSLEINWFTAGSVFISQSGVSFAFSGGTWARRSLTATAPANAAKADIYIVGRAQSAGPANAAISVDNVQFEQGSAATPFAGSPRLEAGDMLGALGGLLPVGYLGAQLDDAGAGTVPLSVPLRRALPAGTALLWDRPTAVWDLLLDAVDLSYHRGRWQRELELPFQEVP